MRLTALFIIYSSTRWKGDTGLSPRNTLETHVMLKGSCSVFHEADDQSWTLCVPSLER